MESREVPELRQTQSSSPRETNIQLPNKSHDQPLTVQPKHECTETQTNCVRDAAARDHICPPSSGTGERKSAACENSAKLKGSSGLPVLLR